MRHLRLLRLSAAMLLLVGFVGGVAFVVGCGGGSRAVAAGGSTTVVHARSLASPVTWMDDYTFSVEFTPTDPQTVVLAVQIECDISTSVHVLLSAQARLPLSGPQQIGTRVTITASTQVGIHAPYSLSGTSLFPAPSYRCEAFFDAVTDGVPVTINSLTIRVITSEGVVVLDPSANLS